MPQRRLFVSDSFAVLQQAFITAVQTIKAASPLTPLAVLVPHEFLGRYLERAVAKAGAGHLGLYVYTLADFAREVAEDALTEDGWQFLSPQAASLILRKLLREEGARNYFAPLAAHPRFPRSLLETIADLKQAEVRPHDLRTFRDHAQPTGTYRQKIDSLYTLYERYVAFLTERQLYDDNDILERAILALQSMRETAPLLLYGFSHLNPLQRRLVSAAFRERDVLVFFPWREGSAYAYATPTLTWLIGLGLHYTSLTTDQERGSALTKLKESLFEDQPLAPNPSQSESVPHGIQRSPLYSSTSTGDSQSRLTGPVTILSAPNKSREVRELGRVVLELVRDHGLRFCEIAILLRDAATYVPLVAETLASFAIPCVLSRGLPLIQTRAGQSLLLLCEVLAEGYARSRVIEFLTTAHPPFPELLADLAPYARLDRWEAFSLKAGIAKGVGEWRERLPRLLHSLEPAASHSEGVPQDEEQRVLLAFVTFMQGFLSACEQLPPVNTYQGWTEQTLCLFRTYVSSAPHATEIEEELKRCNSPGLPDEFLSAKEWYRSVAATLATARSRLPLNTDGEQTAEEGVWVGDLRAAQGVQFRAVLVPGLIEGGFPQTTRQDPVLLDAERQHLGELLLRQLPQQGRRDEEERVLFAFTVQSAREYLVLSYPRLDQDGSQPQVPSGYLLQVVGALSGQPASFTDLEQWAVHIPSVPLCSGPPQTAVDLIEFHLASAAHALTTGDPARLGYLPALTPFFSRALHAARQRWDTPTLTTFDGIIEDETVKASLRRYLFPQGRMTLSPGALETYARCPFQYFLRVVLGLTPREEAEPIFSLSPRDRGALLHAILRDFFTRLHETGQFPLAAQVHASLTSLLKQVTEKHCQTFAGTRATGFPLLWEFEQERMYERLVHLLKRECAGEDHFLPAALTAPFGTQAAEEGQTFFPPGPLSFTLDDGEEINIRGRIDRVNLSPDRRRARILDYKAGRPVRGRFAGGTALQLPLALFAAHRLRPDLLWESAEYVYLDHPNRKTDSLFTQETWAESLAALRGIITTLAQGIRSGCFVSTPSSCYPCPFPSICGIRAESYGADKLADPRLDSLHIVRAVP